MQWGLSGASNQSKLMGLVNGDMVRYQGLSTTGWTVCNLLNLFLAPVTAALSDTFGRIPFMAQGRLAIMGAAQKNPVRSTWFGSGGRAVACRALPRPPLLHDRPLLDDLRDPRLGRLLRGLLPRDGRSLVRHLRPHSGALRAAAGQDLDVRDVLSGGVADHWRADLCAEPALRLLGLGHLPRPAVGHHPLLARDARAQGPQAVLPAVLQPLLEHRAAVHQRTRAPPPRLRRASLRPLAPF